MGHCCCDDPECKHRRPRSDWSRVADGVFLAGLGVFFLLATARGLRDGFWIEAISFWPVLLVSAGIRIVFDRSRLAFAVVLGPVVVLATLFWLAWGDRPELPPPGEWQPLAADRPIDADRLRILLHVSGVSVDLHAQSLSPGLLAAGRTASRGDAAALRVDGEDGEATLRVQGRHGGIMLIGRRHELWELGVSDELPASLDVSGAAVYGDLDLRRGHVENSQVNGAFNAVSIRLPRPGSQVEVKLGGAFNSYDIVVPEGTAVTYDGPGFPLVWVNRGPATDQGLEEGEPGYRIDFEGAFSALDIYEGPAPEGGWREPVPFVEPEPPESEDERGDGEASPPAEAEEGGPTAKAAEAPPA